MSFFFFFPWFRRAGGFFHYLGARNDGIAKRACGWRGSGVMARVNGKKEGVHLLLFIFFFSSSGLLYFFFFFSISRRRRDREAPEAAFDAGSTASDTEPAPPDGNWDSGFPGLSPSKSCSGKRTIRRRSVETAPKHRINFLIHCCLSIFF